jgi:hypothetical protein
MHAVPRDMLAPQARCSSNHPEKIWHCAPFIESLVILILRKCCIMDVSARSRDTYTAELKSAISLPSLRLSETRHEVRDPTSSSFLLTLFHPTTHCNGTMARKSHCTQQSQILLYQLRNVSPIRSSSSP